MLAFLLLGISFGLSASVNPGPSLTLGISRSLRDGVRAGILVALAPLLTDAPIIAVATLLVGSLPPTILGGSAFLEGAILSLWGSVVGARRGAVKSILPSSVPNVAATMMAVGDRSFKP